MTGLNEFTRPAYPATEVGRLVGLRAARVRRWLQRYEPLRGGAVPGRPVLRGRGKIGSYASFLDLVDLLFVKRFLEYGLALQEIHRPLDKARGLIGTDHSARESLFTASGSVFPHLHDRTASDPASGVRELMSDGQWLNAPAILELARQIDFESPHGLARRWYPLGRHRPVVLDPMVAYGAPSIVGRGIKTNNIHDLFVAEGESVAAVRGWWNLSDHEVQAAVDFERRLAA